MKNLCAIIAIIFLIAMLPTKKAVFAEYSGEHIVYVGASGSDCAFITLKGDEIKNAYRFISNVSGEQLSFSSTNELYEILNYFEAELAFSESVCGVTSNYYYSHKISGYKTVNGAKVNLHVALSEKITVGTPIIYGAY